MKCKVCEARKVLSKPDKVLRTGPHWKWLQSEEGTEALVFLESWIEMSQAAETDWTLKRLQEELMRTGFGMRDLSNFIRFMNRSLGPEIYRKCIDGTKKAQY